MPTPDKVFDVDNKMNDEIIFAVRFNKDVEGEGHGYWFSIINLTDDTNQTKALKEPVISGMYPESGRSRWKARMQKADENQS